MPTMSLAPPKLHSGSALEPLELFPGLGLGRGVDTFDDVVRSTLDFLDAQLDLNPFFFSFSLSSPATLLLALLEVVKESDVFVRRAPNLGIFGSILVLDFSAGGGGVMPIAGATEEGVGVDTLSMEGRGGVPGLGVVTSSSSLSSSDESEESSSEEIPPSSSSISCCQFTPAWDRTVPTPRVW